MRRQLLLLRHGKSDWNASYGGDRERPLAPRGVAAAERMGRFLASVGPVPDVLLSSPAVRARTTAELAAKAGGWDGPIVIQEALYGGGGQAVLDTLRSQPADAATVLIVGHEPTWSGLVGGLSGGSHVRFPTAALACLAFDGTWFDLDWGVAELEWMVTPKLLARAGFD